MHPPSYLRDSRNTIGVGATFRSYTSTPSCMSDAVTIFEMALLEGLVSLTRIHLSPGPTSDCANNLLNLTISYKLRSRSPKTPLIPEIDIFTIEVTKVRVLILCYSSKFVLAT